MMRKEERHMNEERFQTLLAAYGGAPARWPEDERAAALVFAAAHPQAANWIAEAEQLDAALGLLDGRAPSRMLRERILAAAPSAHSHRRPVWPFASVWQPAMGMAASLLFGIIAGTALSGNSSLAEQTARYDLTDLAFNSDSEEAGILP